MLSADDLYDTRLLMTPRSRIVGIPRGSTIEAALRIAGESGYSRFPVYATDLDVIDGIVDARDLYEARRRDGAGGIAAVVRPALVVPASRKAPAVLTDMRREQRDMALIVDEHGTVVGLVTLEDILRAIGGVIGDEIARLRVARHG